MPKLIVSRGSIAFFDYDQGEVMLLICCPRGGTEICSSTTPIKYLVSGLLPASIFGNL